MSNISLQPTTSRGASVSSLSLQPVTNHGVSTRSLSLQPAAEPPDYCIHCHCCPDGDYVACSECVHRTCKRCLRLIIQESMLDSSVEKAELVFFCKHCDYAHDFWDMYRLLEEDSTNLIEFIRFSEGDSESNAKTFIEQLQKHAISNIISIGKYDIAMNSNPTGATSFFDTDPFGIAVYEACCQLFCIHCERDTTEGPGYGWCECRQCKYRVCLKCLRLLVLKVISSSGSSDKPVNLAHSFHDCKHCGDTVNVWSLYRSLQDSHRVTIEMISASAAECDSDSQCFIREILQYSIIAVSNIADIGLYDNVISKAQGRQSWFATNPFGSAVYEACCQIANLTMDTTGTASAAQTTTATNAATGMAAAYSADCAVTTSAAASSESADIAVVTSATNMPLAIEMESASDVAARAPITVSQHDLSHDAIAAAAAIVAIGAIATTGTPGMTQAGSDSQVVRLDPNTTDSETEAAAATARHTAIDTASGMMTAQTTTTRIMASDALTAIAVAKDKINAISTEITSGVHTFIASGMAIDMALSSSVTQDDSDSVTDAATPITGTASDAAAIIGTRSFDTTGTASAAQTTTTTNAATGMTAASSESADIAVVTSATNMPVAIEMDSASDVAARAPITVSRSAAIVAIGAIATTGTPDMTQAGSDSQVVRLDPNTTDSETEAAAATARHTAIDTASGMMMGTADAAQTTTVTNAAIGMAVASSESADIAVATSATDIPVATQPEVPLNQTQPPPDATVSKVAQNQAPTLAPPPLNKTAGRQNSAGKPTIVVLGTTGMRLQLFSNFMDNIGIVKSLQPVDEDGLLKLNNKELISLLKENADSGPNSALILDYVNKKIPSARANIDWKQIAVAAITKYQFSWVMLPVVTPFKKGDSARYGISVGELTELLDLFGPGKSSIVATGVIGPDVSSYIPLARSDLENEEELNGAGYSHVKKNLLESLNYFGIAYLVFGGKQYDGRSFFSKVIHHSAAGYFTIAGFFIPEHQIEEEGKHACNAEALYKASHGSNLHINGMKFGQSTLNAYHFKAFENQSQSAGGVELLEYFGEDNCCYFR